MLPLHPAIRTGILVNRGWAERDSRVSMQLQLERASLTFQVDEATVKQILEEDPSALSP